LENFIKYSGDRHATSTGRETVPENSRSMVHDIVARCYGPPARLSWMFQKNENIITVMGLPRLNETMEYDPVLFWRLKNNLHRFHVSGHIFDHNLDFSVSTRDHLRTPPDSNGEIRATPCFH
jgi:hypothetical protein